MDKKQQLQLKKMQREQMSLLSECMNITEEIELLKDEEAIKRKELDNIIREIREYTKQFE